MYQDMSLLSWIVVASALRTVAAQAEGWKASQVNSTICSWAYPRVGVVRDTVYIDGGNLCYLAGLNDGSYGEGSPDCPGNTLGYIYTLNFSTPFNFSSNITEILAPISKAAGGAGKSANEGLAQNFEDGEMFANDGEFITYGGIVAARDAYEPPPGDRALVYEKYDYGAPGRRFNEQFRELKLENVTRYVTSGAGVSVPSENKGFYFSGMRAANFGPIFPPQTRAPKNVSNPNTLSNTLITVDMSTQLEETFTNATLPEDIPARAGGELVFVPVGKEGVLVAIGGVVEPVWLDPIAKLDSEQMARSQLVSPRFMSQVGIYDIATQTWYTQNTTSPPSIALALGCSVVASAADGSSHNIYVYGGMNGLSMVEPAYDSVWLLSLPTFTWKQISQGNETHGRFGHHCVKPYGDQMLVIGGQGNAAGSSAGQCLAGNNGGGIIQGFNLSTGVWMDSYSPEVYSEYQVPAVIFGDIGGDGNGSAKERAPFNGNEWNTPQLAALFSTSYDTSKIKSYTPYTLTEPGPNNTRPSVAPTDPGNNNSGGGGLPKWVAPVLGVVLGLIFITAVVLGCLLYRRRKHWKSSNHSVTDGTSEVNRGRILSWVKGSAGDPKSPATLSATASDYNGSGTDLPTNGRSRAFSATSQGSTVGGRATSPLSHEEPVEAGSEMVHEMPDTSRIQELSATGTGMAYVHTGPATPKSAAARNTSNATSNGEFLSPSTEGNGTWSSTANTGTSTWDPMSPLVSPSTPRPDSPTEGSGGVFGRRDNPNHRTEMSEVSRDGAYEGVGGTHVSISPPTPKREGSDYLSARSVTPQTGKRKSAFGEHFDEKS